MRRKPVTILASALFALVMASPVIAAGSDDDPDTAPSATSTTTVTSDDNPSDDPSDDPTDDPNADDPNADDPDTGDSPSDDPDSDDDTTASSTTTSTTAPSGSSSDPPTTATTMPGGSSSSTCETPETLHEPAPKDGETVVYDAGAAGTVELSRMSQNELQVVSTEANDGWVAEVTADKGSRVKVRFVKDDGAGNKAKTRFAAALDQAGEEIHVRVTDCP